MSAECEFLPFLLVDLDLAATGYTAGTHTTCNYCCGMSYHRGLLRYPVPRAFPRYPPGDVSRRTRITLALVANTGCLSVICCEADFTSCSTGEAGRACPITSPAFNAADRRSDVINWSRDFGSGFCKQLPSGVICPHLLNRMRSGLQPEQFSYHYVSVRGALPSLDS